MDRKFAVIGVGNMARAIISGIVSANIDVCGFYLYDKFQEIKDEKIYCFSFIYNLTHMLLPTSPQ